MKTVNVLISIEDNFPNVIEVINSNDIEVAFERRAKYLDAYSNVHIFEAKLYETNFDKSR